MSKTTARKPYRVVFTPAYPTAPARPGVVVARDEHTAHHEARNIAAAGGHAEVQYIDEGGARHIVAVYPPK